MTCAKVLHDWTALYNAARIWLVYTVHQTLPSFAEVGLALKTMPIQTLEATFARQYQHILFWYSELVSAMFPPHETTFCLPDVI